MVAAAAAVAAALVRSAATPKLCDPLAEVVKQVLSQAHERAVRDAEGRSNGSGVSFCWARRHL